MRPVFRAVHQNWPETRSVHMTPCNQVNIIFEQQRRNLPPFRPESCYSDRLCTYGLTFIGNHITQLPALIDTTQKGSVSAISSRICRHFVQKAAILTDYARMASLSSEIISPRYQHSSTLLRRVSN